MGRKDQGEVDCLAVRGTLHTLHRYGGTELILYQYRRLLNDKGLGYLADLLGDGKLKFSSPSQFNDPFDCYLRDSDMAQSGLPHSAVDTMNHGLQRATGALLGIACLTPDPQSHLMWSHYGDHHRGVCIGFDSEALREQVPKNDAGHALYDGPLEVNYSEDRPDEDAPDRFLTKSKAWSYEGEYRLLCGKKAGVPAGGPGVWSIPRETIREVVLGARMKPGIQERVVEIAANHAPCAVVKKVILHSSTYALVVEAQADQPRTPPLQGHVRGPNGDWIPIPEE